MSRSFSRTLAVCTIGLAAACTVPDPNYKPDAAPDKDGMGDTPDADPDLPRLTVSASAVQEGDTVGGTIEFEVVLSAAATETVAVSYMTADETATEGNDYEPTSGNVSFSAGETSATVNVQVVGDFQSEPDEKFRLVLTNAVGATIVASEATATATVEDDDRGADVNGDGFADLIVGDSEAGADPEGRAYLFLGSGSYEPGGSADIISAESADTIFSSEGLGNDAAGDIDYFANVVGLGDVNGDDFDDIIIVATNSPGSGSQDLTVVYIFAGSAAPPAAANAAAADARITLAGQLMYHLTLVDVDGDGISDVVVAGNDGGYVFSGSSSLFADGDLSLNDATTAFIDGAAFASLTNVGDFNSDGADDLVITTRTTDSNEQEGGYLFFGGRPLEGQIGLSGADINFEVNLGIAIKGAGGADFNGDGTADVVLGSPSHNGASGGEGSLQVYFGHSTPTNVLAADITITATTTDDSLGAEVALGGDFDGDGLGDLIKGMPSDGDGGRALVFFGNASFPDAVDSGARDVAFYGGSGASLAADIAVLDFNGDGLHDLVLSAHNAGANSTGEVYVFLGFPGAFGTNGSISVSEADIRLEAASDGSGFGFAVDG